ncbi:hypothetical protein EDC96DRAFT_570364 [Choanephora cucurbitarum]|nr:hypothetical protein EDC96DRAFT_570364 [Choanephora cucurbitarum]
MAVCIPFQMDAKLVYLLNKIVNAYTLYDLIIPLFGILNDLLRHLIGSSSSTSTINVTSFAYHLNASFKYLKALQLVINIVDLIPVVYLKSISHILVSICAILRRYFALAIVLLPDQFTSLIWIS